MQVVTEPPETVGGAGHADGATAGPILDVWLDRNTVHKTTAHIVRNFIAIGNLVLTENRM